MEHDKEAAIAFRQQAHLVPTDESGWSGVAAAWESLTRALALNAWAGDPIAAGRRATQADPTRASAWSALGEALYLLGDEHETVSAFSRAIELDPSDGWAWSWLADALAEVGRKDEARAARARAEELGAQ